jgi:hypothetical protein
LVALTVTDSLGASDLADPITITVTAPADVTPPTVPTGLTATAAGTAQINLAWNASTDVGGSGVAGYRVFRNGGATAIATVTGTSYADSGLTANTLYSYTVSAFDAASPANVSVPSAAASATTLPISNGTVIRINAASSTPYVDSLGQTWQADTGFNTGTVATNTNAIGGTVDDALYNTERWDPAAAPELQYTFAVPNGTYLVRLHFAENYNGAWAIGARVFDVDVEGVRAFEDIDVFAAVGARTALIKSTQTTVIDGSLQIVFRHQVENPMVNAIEIIDEAPSSKR